MKVNLAKDIIQINGKIIKKFTFMLDALLAIKPKFKITIFYNPQKHKAILDFLHNKFQKRSFLIRRIDFLIESYYYLKMMALFIIKKDIPNFITKKYIVKMKSLKNDKKLIKWMNQIKLDNKFIPPYLIKIIKQKIVYMIFKEFFNEGRNRQQYRENLNLLSYKILELKIVGFGKISLGSIKEVDLKLFNKFVFKDIVV